MHRNRRQIRHIDGNRQLRVPLRQEFRNEEPFLLSLRWRVVNMFNKFSFFFFCLAMQLHLLKPSPLIMIFAYSPDGHRIFHFVLVLVFTLQIKAYFSMKMTENCGHSRMYTRLMICFALYSFALIVEGMILINFPNDNVSNWIMEKLKKFGYFQNNVDTPSDAFSTGIRIFSTAIGLCVASLMALCSNYTMLHNFRREFRQ